MGVDWRFLGLGVAAAAGLVYVGYRLGARRAPPDAGGSARGATRGKSFETAADPVTAYTLELNREHKVLGKLRDFSVRHERGRFTTPIEEGILLTILVRAVNAKKVIDVGVFTGCSAFAMALGLPDGCKVVACDVSEDYTSLGRPFWVEGGVADKIDLRLRPATETLQELLDHGGANSFDIFFIDADKESYCEYYRLGMQLLRVGGLIIVDNALLEGRVVSPEKQDSAAAAIRELNDIMMRDSRIEFVLLNVSDGIGIGLKLA